MNHFSRAAFALMLGLCAPAAADAASPASVPAPVFKVGDSWVYDQTTEKGPTGFGQVRLDFVVERLEGDTMMVGVKTDGAPTAFQDHEVGTDWSQRRVVDNQNTVTTRPLTFPMFVGQSWTIDYVDTTRRGAQTSAHVHRTFTVVGWEDVTVPAGTFHAIKVVAKGVDNGTLEVPNSAVAGTVAGAGGATTVAHTQRGGTRTITRATYTEIYYVPELKNWVKTIEEQYNTDNVRTTRTTLTLVSYKLAP
jgi:hypothetical protein